MDEAFSQKAINEYNLGTKDFAKGDINGALRHFSSAIQDDPSIWTAYCDRGFCCYHLGTSF